MRAILRVHARPLRASRPAILLVDRSIRASGLNFHRVVALSFPDVPGSDRFGCLANNLGASL